MSKILRSQLLLSSFIGAVMVIAGTKTSSAQMIAAEPPKVRQNLKLIVKKSDPYLLSNVSHSQQVSLPETFIETRSASYSEDSIKIFKKENKLSFGNTGSSIVTMKSADSLTTSTHGQPALNSGSENQPASRLEPLTTKQPVAQVIGIFPDVQGHWAQRFIEPLAAQDIIRGFPDGTFRPEVPVTRAEFAALIQKAFGQNLTPGSVRFVDVPITHWAYDAIDQAYQLGFLEGYPNNTFAPEQNIPRVQALVALTNGLDLKPNDSPDMVLKNYYFDFLANYYQDNSQIPIYAQPTIVAATENQLVVNYPDVKFFNANQVATRAEVAAFIYQALVKTGRLPKLNASEKVTQYIVGYQPAQTPPITQSSAGTPPAITSQPSIPGQSLFNPTRLPLRPSSDREERQQLLPSPGITSVTPSAYGKSWRRAGVGIGFQGRTRFTDESDGALALGLGLGDAQKSVGLDVGVAIFNLSETFGDRGGISFKLHRQLPNDFAVALGWQNAIVWGGTDAGDSVYGVVTKMIRLQDSVEKPLSRLYLSAGIGNGIFRSEDDINDENETVGVFGSAALRVAEPVNVIAEWTGQDLTLGVSFVPFKTVPLVVTPAITDVTNNAGDGARFILGIGYGFSF
jgi:hypothetical protein